MSLINIISRTGGTVSGGGGVDPDDPVIYNEPTVEAVWYDNNTPNLRYNGFPYPVVLDDNSIWSIHKLSSTHPNGEKLIISRSIDGGLTVTSRDLTVAGVVEGGVNLCASRIGDYIYLARQEDGQYVEVSRCLISDMQDDFLTATFTVLQTYNFGSSGHLVGTRAFMELSNGNVILPYFWQGSQTGYCALLVSTDGLTFANGATIYSRNNTTHLTNGILGDIPVEPCLIESSPGTLCCVMRRYNTDALGGAYFYHAKSTDLGTTWTTKTDPVIYKFGDVQDGNPLELVHFNNLIYIINCNRILTPPFKIQYCTSSVADFEAENEGSWSAITEVPYTVNASESPFNVPIDFGYCVAFKDWENKLWIQLYDISGDHTVGDEGNGRRCWIYQIKIADPTPLIGGIFFPGTNQALYYGPADDFNTIESAPPGSYVEIPAGTYDYFEAHLIEDITFVVTGGQAVFKSFSCKVGSQNITVDGVSQSGVPHGILTNGPLTFAGLFNTVGTLTIKGWESDGNSMGIQVSHNPTETFALNYCRLIIEDCWIKNTGDEGEGIYVGHDTLSLEVLIDARIRHNTIYNTGRDGIQFRNGFALIHDNDIDTVGRDGDTNHMHAILIGGNTDGSRVFNNTAVNVAGNGFFCNGSGDVVFENNVMTTYGVNPLYGTYVNNYASDTADLQGVNYLKVYMINNDINPVNSDYWFVTGIDVGKDPVSVYFSGNTMHGKINFLETGTIELVTADYDPFVETWAYTYGT